MGKKKKKPKPKVKRYSEELKRNNKIDEDLLRLTVLILSLYTSKRWRTPLKYNLTTLFLNYQMEHLVQFA